MKERSIVFSALEVRAILSGAKTQTRRIVHRTDASSELHAAGLNIGVRAAIDTMPHAIRCPYGVPGDRLWVREAFHKCPHCQAGKFGFRAGGWIRLPSGAPDDGGDRSDDDMRPLSPKCAAHGWMSPIFLPRHASRIALDVVSVRVERLQDISPLDAIAEGIEPVPRCSCEPCRMQSSFCTADASAQVEPFAHLWDSLNAKRAPWSSNPWVWVVEFRMAESAGKAAA